MLKEFKEFALKGNMIDMAVGIIMGAAFGTIVTSLVNDVIMPPIGVLTGGVDFSKMAYELAPAVLNADGSVAKEAVKLSYGKFINAMISFGIIAWVMFMIIKAMNNLKKKEAAAPPPAPPRQEVLLEEIRNLLAKR
jgi:large conductance mechanosensitive channel